MVTKRKRRTYKDSFSSPTKTVGYGYVGRWNDGHLGWFLPRLLEGSKSATQQPNNEALQYVDGYHGDPFSLCRITVEVVPGVRRRIIKRRGQ